MNTKRLLAWILMVWGFTSAHAYVELTWNSASNSIRTDTGTAAPSTWTAQLIWSPDNQISPLNPSAPYVPTGGEIVLLARQMNTNAVNGRIISQVPASYTFSDAHVGGYVYTRVFNQNYNGGNPATPTLYGVCATTQISGPLRAVDNDPINGIEIVTHVAATGASPMVVNQNVVDQPPSSPTLAAAKVGANWVLSWTAPAGVFHLQQTPGLVAPAWAASSFPVQSSGSSHTSVIALPPAGRLHFRLSNAAP